VVERYANERDILVEQNREVSSVKRATDALMCITMSFTYISNSKAPERDPWGHNNRCSRDQTQKIDERNAFFEHLFLIHYSPLTVSVVNFIHAGNPGNVKNGKATAADNTKATGRTATWKAALLVYCFCHLLRISFYTGLQLHVRLCFTDGVDITGRHAQDEQSPSVPDVPGEQEDEMKGIGVRVG